MKNGWKTAPLGDLCEFQRGLIYAKGDEVDVSANVVLRATNIDLMTNLLTFDELKYINDKVVVPDAKKVKKNSLMICTASGSKSHLGKVAFIDDDYGYAFGGFMGMITPKKGLLSRYLFHLMTSDAYKDFIGELSDGANINNLKFDDLGRFQVPHPQLSKQQRIVGILDAALDGVATAKAKAEKNLQNARALFESHLQNAFFRRSKGWVEKPLGALVTRLTNGYVGPIRNIYRESGIPYLLARHVKNNQLVFDGRTFISDEFNRKHKKSMLRAGDVLLVQSGHIGHSAVVTNEHEGHNCHAMIVITPVKDVVTGPFLSLYFNSSEMRQRFEEIRSGSTVPHLTCGAVRELKIALPGVSVQQRLVEHSREIQAETQLLENLYRQKLTALEDLKKSLLFHAFSGKLYRS